MSHSFILCFLLTPRNRPRQIQGSPLTFHFQISGSRTSNILTKTSADELNPINYTRDYQMRVQSGGPWQIVQETGASSSWAVPPLESKYPERVAPRPCTLQGDSCGCGSCLERNSDPQCEDTAETNSFNSLSPMCLQSGLPLAKLMQQEARRQRAGW